MPRVSLPIARRLAAGGMTFGMAVVAVGAVLAGTARPASAQATLPFWSHPFPAGYVVHHRRCEYVHDVRTPDGTRRELVETCDRVLHSRY